jgi:predicted transcriptional regulator of viral defense system
MLHIKVKKMVSIAQKIKNRIKGKGRGWAFTPKDFLDLGSRNNVGQILHRLTAQGFIRQVSRGVYDYPRHDPDIGIRAPNVKQVADAVARATGDRIYMTGAAAANRMGLSTQVPARTAYATTGKPKDIVFFGDNFTIQLRKSTLPRTITRDLAVMALQALDNIGPDYVDQQTIDQCSQYLKSADKKDIQQNLRYIRNPWLADIARQLVS